MQRLINVLKNLICSHNNIAKASSMSHSSCSPPCICWGKKRRLGINCKYLPNKLSSSLVLTLVQPHPMSMKLESFCIRGWVSELFQTQKQSRHMKFNFHRVEPEKMSPAKNIFYSIKSVTISRWKGSSREKATIRISKISSRVTSFVILEKLIRGHRSECRRESHYIEREESVKR